MVVDRLSLSYSAFGSVFGARRSRGAGSRGVLFILECALGVVAVVLVSALAHWAGWLLPVALLLYMLIVVPTALLCGFWQAVIVSLSAVFIHGYFTTHQAQANLAADPANSVTLLVFVLVALVVSRLSARVNRSRQGGRVLGRADARSLRIHPAHAGDESASGAGAAVGRTGP